MRDNFDSVFTGITDEKTLKAAWYALLKKYHPDTSLDPVEKKQLTAVTQSINAAYERAKLSLGSGGEQWSGSFEDIFDYWRQQGWASDEPRTHSNTANGGYSWTAYDKDGKPYTAHSTDFNTANKADQQEYARHEGEKEQRKRQRKQQAKTPPPPPEPEPLSKYEQRNAEFREAWNKHYHPYHSYEKWSSHVKKGDSYFGVGEILKELVSCDLCVVQFDETYLVISGQTYPHKDTIKSNGFQWDMNLKVWWIKR